MPGRTSETFMWREGSKSGLCAAASTAAGGAAATGGGMSVGSRAEKTATAASRHFIMGPRQSRDARDDNGVTVGLTESSRNFRSLFAPSSRYSGERAGERGSRGRLGRQSALAAEGALRVRQRLPLVPADPRRLKRLTVRDH